MVTNLSLNWGIDMGKKHEKAAKEVKIGLRHWQEQSNLEKEFYEGTVKIPGIEGKGDLSKKPHHAAIDPYLMRELAQVMRFGANKHGKNNFRTMTQEAAQEIRDSVSRHFNDGFLCGEEKDAESGMSHLAHMVANVMFLYRLCRRFGYTEVMNVINGGDSLSPTIRGDK